MDSIKRFNNVPGASGSGPTEHPQETPREQPRRTAMPHDAGPSNSRLRDLGARTPPETRQGDEVVNRPPKRPVLQAFREMFKGKTQVAAGIGPLQNVAAKQGAGAKQSINELNINFPVELGPSQLASVMDRSRRETNGAMNKLGKAFDDAHPSVVPDQGQLNPKKSWLLMKSKPTFNQTQRLRDKQPTGGAAIDNIARHALKHGSLQAAEEALVFQERTLGQMRAVGAAPEVVQELSAELASARTQVNAHRSTLIQQASEVRAELLSGFGERASRELALAFDRLDKLQIPEMTLNQETGGMELRNHPAEDALNQTLLATTVKRVFSTPAAGAASGAPPVFDEAHAAEALRKLRTTEPAFLLWQIGAVINGGQKVGAIALLEALGAHAGSPRRLAQLIGLPKSTPTDPADPSLRLKVAIDALRAFTQATQSSPDGKISESQQAWLSQAVQYAKHLEDPSKASVSEEILSETDKAVEQAHESTAVALQHIDRMLNIEGQASETVGQLKEHAQELANRSLEAKQAVSSAGTSPLQRQAALKLTGSVVEDGLRLLESAVAHSQAAGSPPIHGASPEGSGTAAQLAIDQIGRSVAALKAAGAAEAGAATRAKVAYRAVQNGLTTNESGSAYDRMNKELQHLQTDLATIKTRNVRRATRPVVGDVVNYVSGGLPTKLGGTRGMAMRRKAVRQLFESAVKAGMILPQDQLLGSMRKNAAEITASIDTRLKALDARRNAAAGAQPGARPLTAEETLEFGVGMATKAVLQVATSLSKSQAKSMGPEVFATIEMRAKDHLQALGPAFLEEFKRMRHEGTNVAQLMALLADHVDFESMVAANGSLKRQPEPQSLKQRAERTEALTARALDTFQKFSSHLTEQLGQVQQQRTADLKLSEIFATERLEGLTAVAEAFAKRAASLSPSAMLNHVPAFVFREVLVELGERFPRDLAPNWQAMGSQNPDAGRTMRMLHSQIEAALADAPSELRNKVKDELKATSTALRSEQRQVHAERFRSSVADSIFSYADIRSPRDFREMFNAVTSRIGTAEKLKVTDSRTATLDPLQLVTAMGTSILSLGTVTGGASIGVSKTQERQIDVNMHGASMQIWIGKNQATTVSGAVKASAALLNADLDKVVKVGFAVAQAKYEFGHESAKFDGVGLRVDRKGGHEDWMRRDVAAIMGDLSDPEKLMKRQKGLQDGDLIGALLNEHPLLIVDRIKQDKEVDKGELALNLTLARADFAQTVRLPVTAGVARKNLAGPSVQHEQGGATTVTERKVEGQSRVESSLGLNTTSLWTVDEAVDKRSPHEKLGGGLTLSNPLGGIGVTQQLYGSGSSWMDREVRHGGPTGNTYANESKYSVETEQFNDYIRILDGKDIHPIVSNLAKFDSTPRRSESQKFAVAEQRLFDTLKQFGKGAHPETVFSVGDALRESAGVATDAIEALSDESLRAGEPDKSHALAQSLAALRMDTGSWTSPMLLMRSKAKQERGAGIPFVFLDKGVGEATRVQSMMPWTGERVGVHAGKAGMPPDEQSRRMESSPSQSPSGSD